MPVPVVEVLAQGSIRRLELHDLNVGGFSTVCAVPFFTGLTLRFTFTAPEIGLAVMLNAVTLDARAVHSRVLLDAGTFRYMTGWEFVDEPSRNTPSSVDLLFALAGECFA